MSASTKLPGTIIPSEIIPPVTVRTTRSKCLYDIIVKEGATLHAPNLLEIQHVLKLEESARLDAPNLKTMGGKMFLGRGVRFFAPFLAQTYGQVEISDGAQFTAPRLTSVGWHLTIGGGAIVEAPELHTIGYGLRLKTKLTLPRLAQVGHLQLDQAAALVAPHLADCGDLYAEVDATLDAEELRSVASLYLADNTHLTLPHLVTIRDDLGVGVGAHLEAGGLEKVFGDAHFAAGALVSNNWGSIIVGGTIANDAGGTATAPCLRLPARRGVRP